MDKQDNNLYQQVANVIRDRKTLKVLADVNNSVALDNDVSTERTLVSEALASAGWAPFHYDRNCDGLAEPWRAHILWHETCRTVAGQMRDWFSDMKPTNKLPAMLSACGALVLVTWLPQTAHEISDDKKREQVNEEHLAATAAMVQNFLLLLTAAGYGTYWSSGGQFRSKEMFDRLEIPSNEKLSAAVFVEFPKSQSNDLERLPGKNREKRSGSSEWVRTIENL